MRMADLRTRFKDPAVDVRRAVVDSIASRMHEDAIPLLLEALKDPDPRIRFSSVACLAGFGRPELLEPIQNTTVEASCGQDGLADMLGGATTEIRQLSLLRNCGVSGFNEWRETTSEEIYLPKALLRRAKLDGINLSGVHAPGAILEEATLTDASLVGAMLWGARLRGASLQRADLTRASLYRADLRACALDGATLVDADLADANLEGVSLSTVQLEQLRRGPHG
jgi:hypothetical protein